MDRLRIVTLNIWNKSGPWAERRRLIIDEVQALEPDLLGLQEVLRLTDEPRSLVDAAMHRRAIDDFASLAVDGLSPANCQATEIASEFGHSGRYHLHLAFAPAQRYGETLWMGNALLTPHPIVEARAFALPGDESGEQRSLLYALVETPHGRCPTFVTHLNWKLHHGSVRVRQVQFIVDTIAELAPEPAGPVAGQAVGSLPPVLMGDFNAEPDSDEIRYVRGLHTLQGKSVHLSDVWSYAGEGAGYTFDRKNHFAARAFEPPRRIDYIFVRGPDPWLRGEPLEARLAFCMPHGSGGSEIWPSDHFGICADLAVSPRTPP